MARPEDHSSLEVSVLGPEGLQQRAFVVAATIDHLEQHEQRWKPRLRSAREPDCDWAWLGDFQRDELPSPDRETYVLLLEGSDDAQGIISLWVQEDSLYVERLAVAPWNRAPTPEFRGVGSHLFLHAVQRSIDRERGGLVRLHSLEVSNTLRFYRDRMMMVEIGVDTVDGQMMRQLELTPDKARLLLGGQS